MIYKHQYFKLDTEKRKVWDENNRELILTGNPYLLLEFFCEKKSANITEINEHFDITGTRDYTEDHIRQYRNKIKASIGKDIVEYKNKIYSIIGEVEKTENEFLKSESEKPVEISKNNHKKMIAILVALFLIICATFIFIQNKKPKAVLQVTLPIIEVQKPQDDMVQITAGDFIMGSTEDQALEAWKFNDGNYDKVDYLAEFPQRKINLPEFFIDKKEVSNADYKIFVDATNGKSLEIWKDQNLNVPAQPVVSVDWSQADAYCKWLGKRLPTEVEWEKAARGTDGRIWPWGNVWDAKKDNHGNGTEYGYDESDGFKYSAPVGTELGVSPFGVLNMAGNVYEWTSDDFNAYPGNDKYIQTDFNKGYKVVKGGAYTDGQSEQRPASRTGYAKDFREDDFGFRCAKDKQ